MGQESNTFFVLDANKNLMEDHAERCALKMTPDNLGSCVEDGVKLLGISDSRIIMKETVERRKARDGLRKVSTEVLKSRKEQNKPISKSR